MNPSYRYPLSTLIRIYGGLISGQHRSFRLDACEFLSHQPELLQIQGNEFIPEKVPCVVTFNHYHRPGFQAWWLALAVASIIPYDIHWVMTSELTFPGKWYGFAGRPISLWLLKRISKMYGFSTMPPMPPRSRDAGMRASSVRKVLKYIKHHEYPLVGLAPEGSDQPGGILSMPASGVGRFGLLLASKGLSFSPLGIHEANGKLNITIGPQYSLVVPEGLPPHQTDQIAARIIMQHIAELLPFPLRGDFA